MWFGSYNGLHKHEGTAIKVYNRSGKDSASLSSKEMHAVFEDRLGFIWVGTTGGLDKLDPKTSIIIHYKLKPAKNAENWIGYIVSIFQDNKDDLWVVTEGGLFVLNPSNGKYRLVPDHEKSANGMPSIGMLYKGSVRTESGIWMFASGYIVFYDFKTGKFFHQYNNPLHKDIFRLREGNNSDSQSELCIDSSHNLYFVFNNSALVKYNIITEKLDSFHFNLPKSAWQCCYSLAADYKGNIWIGFRYGGLLYFNNTTKQFTSIRYEDVNSLVQSDYVYSLCEDYLDRMWVTTNNGIFIINYYDSIVQQKYLSDKKEFININYPAGIISQDDKGNIYAPFSAGGLFKYNVFNGSNRYFPVVDTAIRGYGYVFTGDKGEILISHNGTMMIADSSSHNIKLKTDPVGKYKFLAVDKQGIAWVFKHNEHAIYFKKKSGDIYYYNGTPTPEKIASTGFSKQACVSKDNRFFYFLSENADLIKRNLQTLQMDTFLLNKKLVDLNFSYANTRDIADDGNGNIWITSQNGLIRYNIKDKNIFIYTTADGLLHDFSFTLCSDSKNRLWVGSMGGVNLYDAQKNIFLNVFPESPDKLSNYFGSSLEATDGHIYFLFGGKLVNVDPDEFFKQQRKERKLLLDEVQVNGKAVDISKGLLGNLTYQENRIYFRFGLLEFAEPEKVKYYYRLEGSDIEWVELGNRAEVTFNALQPGSYIIHIRGTDVYGNQVSRSLDIPFNITPPYWKKWWFKALLFTAMLALIYFIVKWRETNIKAINAEKLKTQQLNAAQYKSQLELEQIINYFSSSLVDKHTTEDVLWDIAKNLIGRLGFIDCMIYLWNDDKTKMIQKAGFGPKDSVEAINKHLFSVENGQGVVGYVMQTREAVMIADTSRDSRYRPDDLVRLSELTVPIIYNNELLGVIDSEHNEKNFFTQQHLQILSTIATLAANKIKSIEAEQSLQLSQIEMYSMNEQLSKAKLEALRSQMNPHFIFNSLNAIQECILTNKVDAAYEYLSKFSKLQRMVLNNSENELIPLSSEIEMLQLYLSLESLRFSKSFTYNIDIAGIPDTDEIMIPSLLTQPLVENAIWHGLRNKEGDQKLTITYEEKESLLFISIDDNGIGREKAAAIRAQKLGSNQFASKGTAILQKRLQVLAIQLKTPIQLETFDKKDEAGNATGTLVILSFSSDIGTL